MARCNLETNEPLRVVVIGISGAGKTTFASRLAAKTGAIQIELDLLNWRANWENRYATDFEGLRSDLVKAMEAPSWIIAGGYSRLRPLTLERGNVVVWLDLPFEMVLRQVLLRSFKRAALKTRQLNGNTESFVRWLDKGHPIRIVLENYYRKKHQLEAELALKQNADLQVYRCKSRRSVENVLSLFSESCGPPTNPMCSPACVADPSST